MRPCIAALQCLDLAHIDKCDAYQRCKNDEKSTRISKGTGNTYTRSRQMHEALWSQLNIHQTECALCHHLCLVDFVDHQIA